MDVTGERIRKRRTALNISQAELAEQVGYKNKTTITKIESGKISPPRSKVVEIAKALQTSPAYLMGWTDDPSAQRDNTKPILQPKPTIPKGFIPLPDTKSVPVIGNIACGTPILAQENIERYISVSSLWKADFALVCKGDSMSPTIQDGDLVCIRSQPNVENGQIAAVLIDDEATLKHFYRKGDTVILHPENPRFAPMTYTKEEINDLHIEGVAVGICRGLPEYGPEAI